MRRVIRRNLGLVSAACATLLLILGVLSWQKLNEQRETRAKHNTRRGLLSNTRHERSIPKFSNDQGWIVLPSNVTLHKGKGSNSHNYDYTLNSPEACKFIRNESQPSILIVVVSSVENAYQRQAIRDTWGLLALQHALNFRVVFLLGFTTSIEQQTGVLDEAYRYGDIVQENFTESFRNLAIKSVMGLKWASTFCTSVDYVMKTDDDIFIHVPNLLNILKKSSRTKLLLCHANRVRKILRKEFLTGVPHTYKKYQVSKEELPGTFYPPYCAGLGYVLSKDTASELYKISTTTPYFFIEDAYITGFCREKLGLQLQDHPAFTLKPPISPQQGICAFQDGRVTTQEMGPQELYVLWREINTQGFFCPKVMGIVQGQL